MFIFKTTSTEFTTVTSKVPAYVLNSHTSDNTISLSASILQHQVRRLPIG
ncbi:hypothetical protein H8K32_11000 [Undibacterium jejuense]|uniref:Uncharacterized protein n=1 Tax=Undibacterium jejuense TaxID=1344949 RepID=A0A923HGK8_9BURK|nr:hypothetical protein [Undibacterium jejuense]